MAEDSVSGSWKPTLSENASNNVIPMHEAPQDVLDSGATGGIVQTKETAPLNSCEEHGQGPLAELKTSGRRICACPPQGILARIATNVVAVALIWAVIWSITTKESLPGGSLFGFLFLYLFAVIGGKIMGLIKFPGLPPLPPLLGMLLVGFLLRNIPWVTDIVVINVKWGAILRSIALAIILARAGLGLDPKALKKLKAVCFRLSLGPCLIEACTAAVISHFLMHLPWQWGFMLGVGVLAVCIIYVLGFYPCNLPGVTGGFVLGAVSPAVVVPSMLVLQAGGYGVDKGVPTLLMAAGSFDDILAITGFNTCLGIAFASGSTLANVFRGILEVAVGIAAGGLLGIFIRYFPSKDQRYLVWKRAFFIIGLSIFAIFSSMYFEFPGSGGLCTIVLAFLAGLSWSDEKKEVEKIIKVAWEIFQPFLFGLIGAEISVASLDPQTVGFCIAILAVGLIARITATFVLVCCAGFELKERIFIALAWIPKATVQAAIGSVALDTAREQGDQQSQKYGMDILTVAFLAILITAPIGALIIGLAGPQLLHKTSDTNRESPIYEEREEIEIHGPA